MTFQAPGVTAQAAQAVDDHNAHAAPADQIASTHYRATGDAVHKAGERLTRGEVITFVSQGIGHPGDHTSFPLSRLAATRGNLIPGLEGQDKLESLKETDSDQAKSGPMAAIGEAGRRHLGGLLRDPTMERYVQVWREVEALAQTGQFSRQYVYDVIAQSPDLTPVQRDKMREQVTILYAARLRPRVPPRPARPAPAPAVPPGAAHSAPPVPPRLARPAPTAQRTPPPVPARPRR